MAEISLDEVKKIAKLSRLKITDEEAEKFSSQLTDILKYAEKINEINTDNIPPTSHSIDIKNALRADTVKPSYSRESIMRNAPEPENGFYKVPKIIE